MWDRAWGEAFHRNRNGQQMKTRNLSRIVRRPVVESLEDRRLLTSSLATLPDISVPASIGYQVTLNGSASGAPTQKFTVTSSNPDIKASIAQGPFITFNITHTPASGQPTDPTIVGSVTFQTFNDLTPKTSGLFQEFINSGFYTNNNIHRIANFGGTAAAAAFVYQGGSKNGDGTGNSGLPNTPYGLELNQQLAFTGPGNLGVAHSSIPNSNDTQFFWNNGPETSLDFQYTMFGQQVNGASINTLLNSVATTTNASGEKSQPISPVKITLATTSPINPSGVVHIDATNAQPGETATITVTALDPAVGGTPVTQTFRVAITTDNTSFVPNSTPVTATVEKGAPVTVQLHATTFNPTAGGPSPITLTTSYSLVTQPAHGTISQFNATTGTFVYTPNTGLTGNEVFSYKATSSGAPLSPIAGNTSTITINTDTGSVRIIGSTLVVTPPPTTLKATNTIVITETGNASDPATQKLVTSLNGAVDFSQPLARSIKRIVVFGAKASDNITIDKSVDPTIPVTLDGGHGGKNVLQAGAGQTREHGWFGQNTLIGGTGTNQLIGRAKHVKFKPTATTNTIFAGVPHPGYHHFFSYHNRTSVQIQPPGGTFYKFVNGKLLPVPTPKSHISKA